MAEMISIDGSFGEGGGQILRTCLALSMITGQPFRIERIRAGRKKPGLMRQHLTAVNAAARIACAQVDGAAIGSGILFFRPQAVNPGRYKFAVGTAGSATLVLQTLLPALAQAGAPSELTLEGGTHNPFAPPFDFLDRCYVPIFNRMGGRVQVSLERPGFYPAGGGRFTVKIEPAEKLLPLTIEERGELTQKRARALISRLPQNIAQRELKVVKEELGWSRDELVVEEVNNSPGPGNVLMIELVSEHITELVTGFGMKGATSETVAKLTVNHVKEYLASGAPVGKYLTDQILVLMAAAGKGTVRALPLSRHSRTNIDIIRKFLDVSIQVSEEESQACRIRIGGC